MRGENDFMGQGSFAQVRRRAGQPVSQISHQLNSTPGVQQESLPRADRGEPKFVIPIAQFMLDRKSVV